MRTSSTAGGSGLRPLRLLVMGVIGVLTLGTPGVGAEPPASAATREERLRERDRLGARAKWLWSEGRDLDEAVAAAEAMLAIERDLLGGDSEDAIGSLELLAALHAARDDWPAALKARREVLAIRTRHLGEQHWRAIDARWVLARDEAISKLDGGRRRQVMETYRSWGKFSRLYAGARYAEAVDLARRSVAVIEEAMGPRHPDYALTLTYLSGALQTQGDLSAARAFGQRALALYREVLGEGHPTYAAGLHGLAMQLQVQGDYAGARPLLEQALAIRRAALGERDPAYAQSLSSLAEVLHAQGDLAAALPLLERAVAVYREGRGEESEEVAWTLGLLASLHEARDECPAAQVALREVLAIRTKSLGKGDWRTIDARWVLVRDEVLARLDGGRRRQVMESYLSIPTIGKLLVEGKLDEAASLARRNVAEIKSTLGERHPDYAQVLLGLASVLRTQGDLAGARGLCEQAVAVNRDVLGERHPTSARSQISLAGLLSIQGDLDGARHFYEQAVAVLGATTGEATEEVAGVLEVLAAMYESRDDWAAAREARRRVLGIRAGMLGTDHWRAIDAHWALARTEAIGKLDAGLRRPAVESYGSLQTLAELHTAGRYTEVADLARRCLANLQETLGEHHPDYAECMGILALVLHEQWDLTEARSLSERALVMARETLGEHHPNYANLLGILAGILVDQGDLVGARPLFEKALAVTRETLGELHPEFATRLMNLVELYGALGDMDGALPLIERALAVRRDVLGEHHPDYFVSLVYSCLALLVQGDVTEAKARLERVLTYYRDRRGGERHPDFAKLLLALGTALEIQGDLVEARKSYEQALTVVRATLGEHHPDYLWNLIGLARVHLREGDVAGAQAHYEQALALTPATPGDHQRYHGQSLVELAILQRLRGNPADARRLADQAFDSYDQFVTAALPTLAEREQLTLLNQTGRVLQLDMTLSADEPERDRDVYRRLLTWKGMVAGAAAAHAHSSRSEARALLAQLTRLRARLNQLYYRAIPPARAEEHARLMRELSEQRSGLEAELARVVHWESRASTPEQVVAALADDTVLVDILYYDRDTLSSPGVPKFQIEPRYTAFVLRKGQPIRRIELGPARPIEQAIRAWRDRLEAGAGDADAAGRAVAWLVWEPLAPRLAGARTVLVAPDAVTCFLPWAALPDREPGTYLLQRYTFSTVGSARALVQHADARPTPAAGGLLTVGGVDYGRADSTPAQPPRLARRAAPIDRGALAFVALPGTKTEAEAISNLYERNAGSQATRVSGPEASKPRLGVLMAGKRYLHLATHGYFAPPEIRSALAPADDPSSLRPFVGMGRREAAGWYPGLLSGLVWAGINHPPTDPILGEPDPGACLMTAEEVAGLDLSACDLAVLSACETGLGQVAGGEGVLGLQRAFHQAGARTVVASLWKVDDAATSVLMEEFYTNLWQRKLPKLEALRRAQIAVLEHPEWVERRAAESQADGPVRGLGRKSEPLPRGGPVARRSPPKWWAGFVLSGDPR